MTDAWQRAITFIRGLDERGAEEVRPFAWGRALINRRFPLVHDANYLIAYQVDGASASELIEAAERIQSDLGLLHRRVNVDDRPAALRMADGFESRGYLRERFVIMVHRRAPDRTVDTRAVTEVGWERLRDARRAERAIQPWGSPALIEQMLALQLRTAGLISTRYFAALDQDRVVSSCELRTQRDLAQIETVETLPEYRHRGLARAVVSAALEAARDQHFVFLVADHDDWPQHFYGRLGFDAVGLESRFLRLLDG